MRRIIVALVVLTLTACAAPEPEAQQSASDTAAAASAPAAPAQADAGDVAPGVARDRVVLFVGTSLTAGYGVGENLAYPALIQQKIDSAGMPFRVVNAGISGETSAGGLRRIDWSLQQPTDVLVLELGANDALRGLDPAQMERNLDEILKRARDAWPGIALVVVGMEAPPNLGQRYATQFRNVFRDLSRRYDAALVPFLLEGVAAQAALNIADGIHPNAAGQRMLADNVWRTLERVLRTREQLPPAQR